MFVFKPTNRHLMKIYALFFSGTLLVGCAPNAVIQQPTPPSSERAAVINLPEFGDQQRMQDIGLLEPFTKYWDAQVSRNWSTMFTYESSDLPLSAEFYKAYHARAWEVLNVSVLKLDLENGEARMRLAVEVRDPKNLKSQQVVYREDKWVEVDGSWRHKITDPLMSIDR